MYFQTFILWILNKMSVFVHTLKVNGVMFGPHWLSLHGQKCF